MEMYLINAIQIGDFISQSNFLIQLSKISSWQRAACINYLEYLSIIQFAEMVGK